MKNATKIENRKLEVNTYMAYQSNNKQIPNFCPQNQAQPHEFLNRKLKEQEQQETQNST